MKIIHIIVLLLFISFAKAQSNPFVKTTWKIEKNPEMDGFILKKTKKLNPNKDQVNFHYIQFENDGKYTTGTDCFQMYGFYSLIEENVVEFSTGAAAMASDCEEPEVLVSNYSFEKISDEQIVLQPIYEAHEAIEGEAYDEAAVSSEYDNASIETATAAVEAIEVQVIKYDRLRRWVSNHFDSNFFREHDIYSRIDLEAMIHFEENGKTTVKEIKGTQNANLIQALKTELEKMPIWTPEEVDYNTTHRLPITYMGESE